jgi:hypothetical protein
MPVTSRAALYTFFATTVRGGLLPFYYYDPFDVLTGHAVGSNYDATGVSTQGRAVVKFVGNWQQTGGINLDTVPQLELREVA